MAERPPRTPVNILPIELPRGELQGEPHIGEADRHIDARTMGTRAGR